MEGKEIFFTTCCHLISINLAKEGFLALISHVNYIKKKANDIKAQFFFNLYKHYI